RRWQRREGERAQRLEPLSPAGPRRQRRETLDERQGHRLERTEIGARARNPGGCCFVVDERFGATDELRGEAVEAALPALPPSNPRRFDQQALPAPRRAASTLARRGADLAKREVLGEPSRREAFSRTGEEREQGAARRMWPRGAAGEVRRDGRSVERLD